MNFYFFRDDSYIYNCSHFSPLPRYRLTGVEINLEIVVNNYDEYGSLNNEKVEIVEITVRNVSGWNGKGHHIQYKFFCQSDCSK